MKSLLQFLSPFAPDQSGAVSALFEFGGLIVICDAGGCTGNICGFDEPRWFQRKSALFSAGLRDMDAILGRDDKLVGKLEDAVSGTGAPFVALIGTPVPAVIATDFLALKRMTEKRTGIPALMIETTGTNLYDRGVERAYEALFREFARETFPVEPGTVGVLGMTPLDFSCLDAGKIVAEEMAHQGLKQVFCYGMDCGLDAVRRASAVEKNWVVAPGGLKVAEYLRRTFGTPYKVHCPWLPSHLTAQFSGLTGKKVLIVHQQVAANAARDAILLQGETDVTVASWFMMRKEWGCEKDFLIVDEASFAEAVEAGGYDVVIGDLKMKRILRNFRGTFLDFPHFAVSGRLEEPQG